MATATAKAATNGTPPEEEAVEPTTYLTVAQIRQAPPDCREEDLDVPEWGGKLKLRSPTAKTAALIKSAMILFDTQGESAGVDIAAAELVQVRCGVVEPPMSEDDVAWLQMNMGPSWQRVIEALDKLAGPLGKPGQDAEAAFPGSG